MSNQRSDVLAMKEACKRVALKHFDFYSEKHRTATMGDDKNLYGMVASEKIAAAIDKLSPEVKALPDWKQDQAETMRIKPRVKAEGVRGEPVAIKPLEWTSEPPYSVARVLKGHYSVEYIDGLGAELRGTFLCRDFETVSAAKAAARDDYEQRIRSALYTHPASPPDVEAIASALHDLIGQSEDTPTILTSRGRHTIATAIASAIRTGGQK